MVELLVNREEDIRSLAATVLGVSLTFCDEDAFKRLMENHILNDPEMTNEIAVLHGQCMALGQALKYNKERCSQYHQNIITHVITYIRNENLQVCMAGISACQYVLNAYSSMDNVQKVWEYIYYYYYYITTHSTFHMELNLFNQV